MVSFWPWKVSFRPSASALPPTPPSPPFQGLSLTSWLCARKQSDDSSPASFEKALSALSKKITTTQSRLEWTRLRSRKIKLLGTLYTSFAYLVSVIVLLLVVGYPNLGPWEWTGMAGGPVL